MIITNLENKEVYNPFADLEELRNDWSDEIPSEIISGPNTGNFKVKKSWWTGLSHPLLFSRRKKDT